MPMQVPSGHLVQQVVDEEGILTHVILSPFPGPPSAYMQDGYPLLSSGDPGTPHSFFPRPLTLPFQRNYSQLPLPTVSTGVNVIISPKTSPGLAVAGPMATGSWPANPPTFAGPSPESIEQPTVAAQNSIKEEKSKSEVN